MLWSNRVMRPAIHWVKAIGASVAAAGAVGIAISHPAYPEAARVWLMVWICGAVPWLLGNLVMPEPGYRPVSRFPFLERKDDPAAVLDTGRWIGVAVVVARGAFIVHAAALVVYLVNEIRDAV
jgi:hypothetical protein